MNVKLLAFCLGDGSIDNRYRLFIRHCTAQKEYIEWKQNEINSIIPCSKVTYVNNSGYGSYSVHTNNNICNIRELKDIRDKLYSKDNKKFFSKEIVDSMDAYCFAILYMDDGSLSLKRRNKQIYSYDLTISVYGEKEECQNLIDKLSMLGMKFTLKLNKGKYSIRCGTKNARKFLSYISKVTPNLSCFKLSKFRELKTNFTSF